MKKVLSIILAAAAVLAGCQKAPEVVLVKAIQFASKTVSVEVGKTVTVSAVVAPSEAANKTIAWSIDPTSVATISDAGVVTGVAPGEATITAKSTDGGNVSATMKVVVTAKPVPITSIEVSEDEVSIKAGETSAKIEVLITPEEATNKNLEVSYSKTGVATWEDGVITAIAAGSTVITLKATDGSNQQASINVTVIDTQNMFVLYPYSLLRTGGKLTQTVWYGNVNDYANRDPRAGIDAKNLTLESDNPAVATVEAVVDPDTQKSQIVVTAVAPGKANITATDAAGSTISFEVNVEDKTEHTYDDYLPGISLYDCHSEAGKWSGNYKDGLSLVDGYVPGTQCLGATVNGYKIAEVYLRDFIDVSKIENPALFLRIYISDPSKMTTAVRGEEPYIELRSTSALGKYEEVETKYLWHLNDHFTNMDDATPHAKQTLKAGWNNIVLPFDATYNGRTPDKTGITYFRMFQMHGQSSYNEVEYRFDQIRVIDWTEFEKCDNFAMWHDRPAQQNQYSYFNDTVGMAEGTGCVACIDHLFTAIACYRLEMWPGLNYAFPATYDLDDLKLQLKFYVDQYDVEWFNKFVHFRVELGNSAFNPGDFTPDNNAIEMSIGATTDDPLNLVAGWNTLTFNFSDFAANPDNIKGDFDIRNLGYFRVILTPLGATAEDYGYRTYKLDDIRILKK